MGQRNLETCSFYREKGEQEKDLKKCSEMYGEKKSDGKTS